MCLRSSSESWSRLRRNSSRILRPESWPTDSPPPLCQPTVLDSSVSSHRSSSAGFMLTASVNSRYVSPSGSLRLIEERLRLVYGVPAVIGTDPVLRVLLRRGDGALRRLRPLGDLLLDGAVRARTVAAPAPPVALVQLPLLRHATASPASGAGEPPERLPGSDSRHRFGRTGRTGSTRPPARRLRGDVGDRELDRERIVDL